MSKCKHEIFSGKCDMMSQDDFYKCVGEDICACYKPMTNADRIRAMTDEELAEHFALLFMDTKEGVAYSTDEDRWLEWLQEPVKGDAE